MIDEFLCNHPEFELVEVNERVKACTAEGIAFDGCRCKNIGYTRRFYPHISKGEGQFMAVLHNISLFRNLESATVSRYEYLKSIPSSAAF